MKKKLAENSYDAVGTLKTTTYYDKGQSVYRKSVDVDIYGRMTRIAYRKEKGDNIYAEELDYPIPLLNRVLPLKHIWGDNPV